MVYTQYYSTGRERIVIIACVGIRTFCSAPPQNYKSICNAMPEYHSQRKNERKNLRGTDSFSISGISRRDSPGTVNAATMAPTAATTTATTAATADNEAGILGGFRLSVAQF